MNPSKIAWHPTSEQLPDDGIAVLIATPDGETWMGFIDAGQWCCIDAMPMIDRPTHWAHMPKGPQ